MSKPIIKVENLSKQYRIGAREEPYGTLRESLTGAVKAPFKRFGRNGNAEDDTIWALKDVSFEVQPGEVVGIIGRNGAGKSTLLKVLSRITEPTTGSIKLYGRVASLLEVGTGFHPELTGRENIFLNGAILGMGKREIEKKFDEMVAFAEVEKFIDTPVKRYSSGMYLRLAFAVAAHLDPEILVVDEVLAVGDAAFQKKCMGKMSDVASQGRTVLFVSHNMAAVLSLCTKGLLLHGGCINAEGSADEVVATYNNLSISSQSTDTDLASMPRQGNGAAKIVSFRIIDKNGKPVDRVTVGEPAQFEVGFQCYESLRSPSFGIVFSRFDGFRVLRVLSSEMNGELPPCATGGVAICRVDKLMLTPGSYLLTIGIGNGQVERVDYVEQCVQIDVEPADIYGTGRVPTQASSVFLASGRWASDYK